ncbi:MAG: TetR family transcriptional regulator [Microbacterium arborescens]
MPADDSNRDGRAPRRSQDDVVEAALDLLDRVGLPDLSMRRLADHLGVQPSALYWHVANKQTLLAAVSARIIDPRRDSADDTDADDTGADADAIAEGGLDDAARALGTRLHERLLAHRDGAEVVSSSLALGLVESPIEAHLIRVAARTGAPVALARAVADAVTHFVVGFTFHEQQRRSADAWGAASASVGASPDLVAAGHDDGFAAALDLIAAGAAARLNRPADGSTPGASRRPLPR